MASIHTVKSQIQWLVERGGKWYESEMSKSRRDNWIKPLHQAILKHPECKLKGFGNISPSLRAVDQYFETGKGAKTPSCYFPLEAPRKGIGKRLFLFYPKVTHQADDKHAWSFSCDIHLSVFYLEVDEEGGDPNLRAYGHRFECPERPEARNNRAHVQMLNPLGLPWLCQKVLAVPIQAVDQEQLIACTVMSLYGAQETAKLVSESSSRLAGPAKKVIRGYCTAE